MKKDSDEEEGCSVMTKERGEMAFEQGRQNKAHYIITNKVISSAQATIQTSPIGANPPVELVFMLSKITTILQ